MSSSRGRDESVPRYGTKRISSVPRYSRYIPDSEYRQCDAHSGMCGSREFSYYPGAIQKCKGCGEVVKVNVDLWDFPYPNFTRHNHTYNT